MTQGFHPPFPSPSGAAICASTLEEMDEETDPPFWRRLFVDESLDAS